MVHGGQFTFDGPSPAVTNRKNEAYRRRRDTMKTPSWTFQFVFWWTMAACSVACTADASMTAHSGIRPSLATRSLDLSCLHRTNSSMLSSVLQQELDNIMNSKVPVALEIDLTASLQGKDTLAFFRSLRSTEAGEYKDSAMSIAVNFNHLTPLEVIPLFESILHQDPPSQSNTSNASTASSHFSLPTVQELNLGWNNLGKTKALKNKVHKKFLTLLQKVVESPLRCPRNLRLHVCGLGPAACRAISKGLVQRHAFSKKASVEAQRGLCAPISLYLTRNPGIGDTGVQALASGLATIATRDATRLNDGPVLDVLDLSGCGISDVGVKALASAIRSTKCVIRRLDLSNNHITNKGVLELAAALVVSPSDTCKLQVLDLSHNKDVGDEGAQAMASAIAKGVIYSLVVRSCHVHADGAAHLARSVKELVSSPRRPSFVKIDLSGNPLGTLRKKGSHGTTGSSAAAIRKAKETTTAYMNYISKKFQKSLNELGMTDTASRDMWDSDAEGDDAGSTLSKGERGVDLTSVKCGGLAMADAFLGSDGSLQELSKASPTEGHKQPACKVELGLRRCALDTRASEALAAVRQGAQSASHVDLVVDVRMNDVLEEDTIAALAGKSRFAGHLHDMAERYEEAMERLRVARRRSLEAAEAAAQRLRAETELEDTWGAPVDMGDDDQADVYDNEEGSPWDSDQAYDDPEYDY
eukprot:Nitzschia sp. Nitz4//scaffold3_size479765//424707//426800//NITZ4_000180-RA/size479765-processed-gene-1.551-mRNA-1//-1//CDS//3329550998//4469//frame0